MFHEQHVIVRLGIRRNVGDRVTRSERVDSGSVDPHGVERVDVVENIHFVEVSQREWLEAEPAELPGEIGVPFYQYGVDSAPCEEISESGTRDPGANNDDFRLDRFVLLRRGHTLNAPSLEECLSVVKIQRSEYPILFSVDTDETSNHY